MAIAIRVEEKRRFPRIKTQAALRYQIRGTADFSNTIANNLSAGGLCFTNDRFIPHATPVMLELNVLSKTLTPIGKIAWTSAMPHSDRYQLGVEFIEIEPQERDYLKDYVNMQLGKI